MDLVLRDFHLRLEFEDLSPIHGLAGRLGRPSSATAAADAWTVHHDAIGVVAERHVLPGMTGLATGRAATLLVRRLLGAGLR